MAIYGWKVRRNMMNYNEMRKEFEKCYTDKTRIYLIEHYLSTFDATQRKNCPFTLFPRQKVFLTSLAENGNTIAIKPRQAGITTCSAAWIAGQIAMATKESPETVLLIGNKLDLPKNMIIKITDFLDQIPRWMWGNEFYSPDPDSPKNKRSIYKKKNQTDVELWNGCKIHARSSGKNASRGVSAASILFFDEAAFIEEGAMVYASAVAATSSVKDAKIIMVSTPNGKDELYYKTYRQALSRENNYNAVQFRWYQDPRYNKFLKWWKKDEETGEISWIEETVLDESGRIMYNESRWANFEKEGWHPTSPWYVKMCQSFNNDSIKIAQELDVSFMGSANNVIPTDYIEMQERENACEPLTTMVDPFVKETWFWKAPIEGHRYICGVDASRGDAADASAIEIVDIDAIDENGLPCFEQVMEYNGKKTADFIADIVYNYATMYNEAYVVIDCIGGVGDPCALALRRMGYKNLYYDDPSLKSYTKEITRIKYNHEDKVPGFHSSSVRDQMLMNFATMVKNNELKIRSMRVINELDTWIFKGDAGRMDHMDGCHDDTITCLAMALFVMKYSFLKMENNRTRDSKILKAYTTNGNMSTNYNEYMAGKVDRNLPKTPLPFYTSGGGKKSAYEDNYMWLFSQRR